MLLNARRLLATLACSTLLTVSVSAQANLVQNGSFDEGFSYVHGYGSSLSHGQNATFGQGEWTVLPKGWTTNGKLSYGLQVAAPGGASPAGGYEPAWPGFPDSPVGGNFVKSSADSTNAAVVIPFSQLISGLVIGDMYELSFWQAASTDNGVRIDTRSQWQVSFGADTQLSDLMEVPYIAANNNVDVADWNLQTMTFTATSTQQTLAFLARGGPQGKPPIAFLDGISLTSFTPPTNEVPEPASLALFGASLALLAVTSQRRRLQRKADAG